MSEIDHDKTALEFLRSLNPEQRSALVQAFEVAQPALTLQSLGERIAKDTSLDADGVQSVAMSLGTWCGVLESDRQKENGTGIELVLRILHVPAEENQPDEKALAADIARLLACERSLGITYKAQGVLWDNPRNYRDARIVTEVRPVFPSNLQKPEAAVLIHQLRLVYAEDGNEKSIHMAMDRNALAALYNVLDRAWKKEESLRQQNAYRYLGLE